MPKACISEIRGHKCAGVLVGLLALGESMPMSLGMQALRLLSWASITLGVSALAGGKGARWHG